MLFDASQKGLIEHRRKLGERERKIEKTHLYTHLESQQQQRRRQQRRQQQSKVYLKAKQHFELRLAIVLCFSCVLFFKQKGIALSGGKFFLNRPRHIPQCCGSYLFRLLYIHSTHPSIPSHQSSSSTSTMGRPSRSPTNLVTRTRRRLWFVHARWLRRLATNQRPYTASSLHTHSSSRRSALDMNSTRSGFWIVYCYGR